jgi:CysZ protein
VSLPVHQPAAPLAVTTPAPTFGYGLSSFFRGFSLLARMPDTYGLAMVPVAAAVVITFIIGSIGAWFVPDLIEKWMGGGGFWTALLQVFATLVFIIFSVLLGLGLAQPASGPALEAIVRRTEKKLGYPEHEPTPFITDIVRSAGSAALGIGGALTVVIALTLVGFIPGAVIVTVPLKLVAAAFFLAWDVIDYPLSVRGVKLGQRLAFVARNFKAVAGFAVGLALVALIPCGFLLILPVGVVGATALVAPLAGSQAGSSAPSGGRNQLR